MWHCVAATKVLFEFVGLTCVLASGLIPAYSLHGEVASFWTGCGGSGGANCELGVWRTKCSWWIDQALVHNTSGSSDMATYDFPLLQDEWIAPVMVAVYTTVLVLGVTTMVWQLAAAREGACLQAKAHGWHYCEWALHLFTALLGAVYPVFVFLYSWNFWVVYTNDKGCQLSVRPGEAGSIYQYVKPGFFVAWAGAFFLVVSLVIRCIEACLTRSAPLTTVAVDPEEEEGQPIVGQVVNKAVYHTCA